MKGRKPALTALVSGGRALEDYVMDNGAEGVADIGYTKMEQRYNTLQVGLVQFPLKVGLLCKLKNLFTGGRKSIYKTNECEVTFNEKGTYIAR